MAVIAGLMMSAWVGLTAAPASAASTPFDPNVAQVFLAQDNPTQLYAAQQTGSKVDYHKIGDAVSRYNAIGYNTTDNYLWGLVFDPRGNSEHNDPNPDGHLLRIGSDGVAEPMGPTITGLASNTVIGSFGEGTTANVYYAINGDPTDPELFAIDFSDFSVTHKQLKGDPFSVSDMSYADGYLWGAVTDAGLVRLDPAEGEVVAVPLDSTLSPDGNFGSVWTYGNGNIGISDNHTGIITQIHLDNPSSPNPTGTIVSNLQGPAQIGTNQDGASSPGAPIDLGITKTATPSVAPGGAIQWELTVTNNSAFDSSGFVVQDTLPAGVTGISPTGPNAGLCTVSAGTATCVGGVLHPNEVASYALTGAAPMATASTTIVNTATVTGNEADANPGNNSASANTDIDVPVANITVLKSVDVGSGTPVVAGQVVNYTLTFSNSGQAAGTVAEDDVLTNVLDDATLTGGPTSSDPALSATLNGDRIAVAGTLQPAQVVTVSYQVTVKPDGQRGDDNLANFVVSPGGQVPPGPCASGDPLCTTNPMPDLSYSKSVNPSTGTPVVAGQVLTYTLSFTNNGTAPGAVSRDDVLTDVLDDATLTGAPTSSGQALSATLNGDRIAVAGTLDPSQAVTVSYQVTVKPDGQRGNNSAANFLVQSGGTPGGSCASGDRLCTTNPMANVAYSKSVTPSTGSTVVAGQVLTYTLSFTNNGTAPGAVSRDDVLTDVLDDASLTAPPVSSNPAISAVVSGDRIQLTGTLPAATTDPVTVTYQVTVKPDGQRGNNQLGNFVVLPGETPGGPCVAGPVPCTVNPVPYIISSKSVAPASGTTVTPGQVLTYTLTFQNVGMADGTVAQDDLLSDVLDDADLTSGPTSSNASLGVAQSGNLLQISGTVPKQSTVTVTYQVTVRPDGQRGNDTLTNFLVPTGTPPPGTCDTSSTLCTVNNIPHIIPSKSVDPASGSTVTPGQVLTYTLTFQNVGSGGGTVAQDDLLSDVLDDADLTSGPTSSNASLSVAQSGNLLQITGAVAATTTVTVTYQVTVRPDGQRGNDQLSNFLVPTGTPPPGNCDAASELCTVNHIPHIISTKAVDPTSGSTVTPGTVLTYTLSFQNVGTADGTLAKDDVLTDVLDDGDLTSGPTSSNPTVTAALNGNRIQIGGTVAQQSTVTVTYQVTVRPDGSRGNDQLSNFLVASGTTPPDDCDASAQPCTVTHVPHIVSSKSVDPASGTTVVTGKTLTYTLTFHNVGTGTGAFGRDDVLTDLLDDATIVTGPTSSDPAVTATMNGDRIVIAGTLAANASATVSYSVTVNDDDDRGNSSLVNYLVQPGGQPGPDCAQGDPNCTKNPSPQILDSKSSDPASGATVLAGDTVSFLLTFHNGGTAAGAVARDDALAGVLDDADLVGGFTVSDPSLQATLDGSTVHVTGNLAVDQTVTVAYQAKVRPDDDRGDNILGNFLIRPGNTPPGTCEPTNPDCTAEYIPLITGTKSVDPASGTTVVTGQQLDYTLTFTNSGAATGNVDYEDILTGVLDDATLTGDPVSSDPTLTPVVDENGIHVTGPLAVNQTVEITYSVIVKPFAERGDSKIGNFLVKSGETPPDDCADTATDCTTNAIPHLSVLKTSDATPTEKIGDVLKYEVTVTNDGTGDFTEDNPASVSDDLTSVLDDATYNDDVTATATDGSDPEVTYEKPILSWTGPLAVGDSIVIEYSVTTTGAGDQQVTNDACAPNEGEDASCATTTTGLASIDVSKSVDPASGSVLQPGQVANYTLTVTNSGTGEGSFSYTDWLSDVLDDATITGQPATSQSGVTITPVDGNQFTVKGLLAGKSSFTVTYSVTVNDWDVQGDHSLGNWVTATGTIPNGDCPVGDDSCTSNPIQPLLANTGFAAGTVGAAAGILLIGGLALLFLRRRRRGLAID